MKNIAIYGAGGFGREVQMLIEQINEKKITWRIIGFYDDGVKKGEFVNGIPLLGGMDELSQVETETFLVFAVGNPITKKKLVQEINNPNIRQSCFDSPECANGLL